jgi:hypothetical protein
MNCKSSHTITTASAPGQYVNTKKRKAMSKITELSKLISVRFNAGANFKCFFSFQKKARSTSFECHISKKPLNLHTKYLLTNNNALKLNLKTHTVIETVFKHALIWALNIFDSQENRFHSLFELAKFSFEGLVLQLKLRITYD